MVRVAGYDEAQIANAAIIADVARSLDLGDRGALLGVMCAMGESSLRNIDYGDWETNGVRNPDGTPTTSIGLFQQQASWGSVSDRMDPLYAAWRFFDALSKVRGWRELAPTVAIHRVQINADPNHYAKYATPARAVLAAIPDLRAKGVIMADPMDIIEVPWQPGNYARRALVDAVARAGKPRGNSWGRLKDEQQRAWDRYQDGTGSPADDPNRPNSFPLAHVRFIAVDVDATADNVRRLLAVGLVRPYSYEPWHFQLPGSVYKWPLVDRIPRTADSDAKPFEEDDMDEEQDNRLKNVENIIVALWTQLAKAKVFEGVEGVDLDTPRLKLGLDASIDTWNRYVIDADGNGTKDFDLMQLTRVEVQPKLNEIAKAIDLDVLADKIADRLKQGGKSS